MADRQQGFSLIETLVALALLGLVSGIVYSSYSTSMAGVDKSARVAIATRFAKSKLEEVSATGLLEIGETGGVTEDSFSWRVTVEPLADERAARAGAVIAALQPALVSVTVSWQGLQENRSVTLTTVRLVAMEENR